MNLLRRLLSWLRGARPAASPHPSGPRAFLELTLEERRLVVLCCARTSAAPGLLALVGTARRAALTHAARTLLALPSAERHAVLTRHQSATVLHEVALARVVAGLRQTPLWWQQLVAQELPGDVRVAMWRALEREPPRSPPTLFDVGPHPALRTLAARFVERCLSATSLEV